MKRRRKNDGGLFAVMLCGLAEGIITLIVYIVGGLFIGAVKVLWAGLCWIAAENRKEVKSLNEERRAKLEALDLELACPEEEEDEEEEDEWEDLDLLDELEEEGDEDVEDEAFCHLLHGRTLEKATADEERRLLALYRRKDKLEFINKSTAEAWEKFQATKTWRGLLWEIEDAEERLARLEKAAV